MLLLREAAFLSLCMRREKVQIVKLGNKISFRISRVSRTKEAQESGFFPAPLRTCTELLKFLCCPAKSLLRDRQRPDTGASRGKNRVGNRWNRRWQRRFAQSSRRIQRRQELHFNLRRHLRHPRGLV